MSREISNVLNYILALPRDAKRLIVLVVDICICTFSVWLAYYLRLGEFVALSKEGLFATGIAILLAVTLFFFFGLYNTIFRYSGLSAISTIAKALVIYGIIYAAIFTAFGVSGVPRTIGIIQPSLLLIFIASSRVLAQYWLDAKNQEDHRNIPKQTCLIYGAGASGRQLAAALKNNNEMRTKGFLDDNSNLHGQTLNGLPIFASEQLPDICTSSNVSHILLAMPNISRGRRNEIISQIKGSNISLRDLPSVSDLAKGRISISDLRDLDINDLLGREPVVPEHSLLEKTYLKKL